MDMRIFDEAAACLPDECFKMPPDLGVVLGSGWGDALCAGRESVRVSYADIKHLDSSSVAGHHGEFVLFEQNGRRIAAWCGRRHRYEGVGWESVVMSVEMLRRMGCPSILLTNASGGINPALRPGDFVVVRDHINLTGENPLAGPCREEWGGRFPDMSEVYDRRMSELLHAGANALDIRAMDGVYAYASGPCYETPAEIRAYRAQGADVVGMSTVPEAVFAKACGMKTACLSFVSNLAAGISSRPLSHDDVVAAASSAKSRMKDILSDFVWRL